MMTIMQTTHSRIAKSWWGCWRKLGNATQWYYRAFRTLLLSLIKFRSDDTQLHASALTFYSLIALVPTATLLLGIAKGFGLYDEWATLVVNSAPHYEEALTVLTQFSQNLLREARGSVIAGVGFLLLFWSFLKTIAHVETAFNQIWRAEKSRSMSKKISEYLPLMFIAPMILIVANSIKVYFLGQLKIAQTGGESWVPNIEIIAFFSSAIPIVAVIAILAWVYYFLPNTHVPFRSCLWAGSVAGILFDRFQWLYIDIQVLAAKYDAVYGSFIALPLLFFWIYLSWFIILWGAQVAFVIQNRIRQPWELVHETMSSNMEHSLMLETVRIVVSRYVSQKIPLSAHQLCIKMGVPMTYVRPLLRRLERAHVIYGVQLHGSADYVYIPSGNLQLWRVQAALAAIDNAHSISQLSHDSLSYLHLCQLERKYAHFLEDYHVDADFRDIDDDEDMHHAPPDTNTTF